MSNALDHELAIQAHGSPTGVVAHGGAAPLENQRADTLISAIFFLCPSIASLVPRLTWLLLPVLAGTLIIAALRQRVNWRNLIEPNAALVAILIVVAYVFVNASWAVDRGVAFGKAALLLWVVLITFVAKNAVAELDAVQLRRAALYFVAGAFLGTTLISLELLTGGSITRSVINSISMLQPLNPKRMVMEGNQISAIQLPEFNQNITVSVFNLWPALLILASLVSVSRRAILIALFFIVLSAAVFLSDHQSSQIALVASLLFFIVAKIWPRKIVPSVAAIWVLGFALALPLSFSLYKNDLHMAQSLPTSARARIIIWEYTAERVLEHPWLGIGADSTRALAKRQVAEQPKGFVIKRTTAWHAHDLFLQVWFELGLIGVILIAAAGVLVTAGISDLALQVKPYAAATFAVFVAVAAFGWGIWQTWLICSIALMLIYFALGARCSAIAKGGEPSPDEPDYFAGGTSAGLRRE
jgi:O-antigen ligase